MSASIVALAKNGMNESLTPSRSAKSSFTRVRRRAIWVTSTSTTGVSWAATCSDSTIRSAMILRSRLIFSVVPRFGSGVTLGAGAPPDAACGRRVPADAAGAAWVSCDRAASSTSCLRIRPPTPDPVTVARSTLCWAASLRTSGVT